MKKILKSLFIFGILLFPAVVFGDNGMTIVDPLGGIGLQGLIDNIVNFITFLAIIIAPLIFIYAGFQYYAAAGNPEEAKKAANTMKWAVIGLVIIFIANGLVSIIQDVIGVS